MPNHGLRRPLVGSSSCVVQDGDYGVDPKTAQTNPYQMNTLLSHPSQSLPLNSSQLRQWRNRSIHSVCPRGVRLLRLPVYAPRCVAASSPADSAAFNGWGELGIGVDPAQSGESNLVRNYLISLGFDDRKYVFVYMFGFVCALAISRVRVSSIVVVPAAAIVFAIGFSFGFVNGGPRGGAAVSLNGRKRKSKEEDLRIPGGVLRNLIKLFDDFDVRIGKLKENINKAVETQGVGVDDLKSYVDAVDLIGLCVKNARNVVEECVDSDSVDDHEIEGESKKKMNRKRIESTNNGFNWFQLAFGFLQSSSVATKSSKKKESARNNEVRHASNLPRSDLLDSPDEERLFDSKFANDGRRSSGWDSDNAYSYQSFDFKHKTRRDYEGTRTRGVSEKGNFGFMGTDGSSEILQSGIDQRFDDCSNRQLNFESDKVRITDNQQVTLRMSEHEEVGRWISHDDLDDNIEISSRHRRVSVRHGKQQRTFSGAFESFDYSQKGRHENYSKSCRGDDQFRREMEFVSSSSSMPSDDDLCDEYLTKAHNLLSEAKESLRVKNSEMRVEQMLKDSARLLSRALSLKPLSLPVVGLLGNTYLLRGELKFRFSQELRCLISGDDDLDVDRWNKIPVSKDEPVPSREKLINLLIDVCEECDELLVEAGRIYRMALSIDGNDVRALYNWGLALSFRAQLIADVGPEAASDADRLFLAAIDKFDAMMSRSKTYAPDALFRWGMVLQQRSRIKPSTSKDKTRLLQQAKRLYEDALDMGFDKLQAKEALSSCVLELNPGRRR